MHLGLALSLGSLRSRGQIAIGDNEMPWTTLLNESSGVDGAKNEWIIDVTGYDELLVDVIAVTHSASGDYWIVEYSTDGSTYLNSYQRIYYDRGGTVTKGAVTEVNLTAGSTLDQYAQMHFFRLTANEYTRFSLVQARNVNPHFAYVNGRTSATSVVTHVKIKTKTGVNTATYEIWAGAR